MKAEKVTQHLARWFTNPRAHTSTGSIELSNHATHLASGPTSVAVVSGQ